MCDCMSGEMREKFRSGFKRADCNSWLCFRHFTGNRMKMTKTDSSLIKLGVFELLSFPSSSIPPPINLLVWLRPLCCGGRRLRPEYFEVDYCSTHTFTHHCRSEEIKLSNGLSRCARLNYFVIISASQIKGESSGLQGVRASVSWS